VQTPHPRPFSPCMGRRENARPSAEPPLPAHWESGLGVRASVGVTRVKEQAPFSHHSGRRVGDEGS
jgi:hypothetical protein